MQDNSYRGKPLLQSTRSEWLYEDGAYDACAVDEIGCRNGSYAVGFVDFVSAIKEERIGDIKIRAERGNITFWIGLIDAKQGKLMLCCVLRIGALQERNFRAAGRARFGPEVENDRAPAQSSEVDSTPHRATAINCQRKNRVRHADRHTHKRCL